MNGGVSSINIHVSLSLCLSFRLWIPRLRGQPHSFSFSIQHDSLCPPPEPQVLHVVLDDVSPSFSLSSSTSFSLNICLQDSRETVILFLLLYMPIPSQPGLTYLLTSSQGPCFWTIDQYWPIIVLYTFFLTAMGILFLWSHNTQCTCTCMLPWKFPGRIGLAVSVNIILILVEITNL